MKLKKMLGFTIVLALIVVSLSACGDTDPASSDRGGKEAKIVFWNSAYPTIDENDKSKKKEDFYIFQAVKRFEEANTGIEVEVQDVPGGNDLFTKFQTSSIAKNGPDVTVLWSGNYMLKYKQFLEPLNGYVTNDFVNSMNGWEAVTEGFIAGKGDIFGVPAGTDGVVTMLYNKKIFKEADIDPIADRPNSFEEFLSIMEKLKANGVTPISMENGEFFNYPNYWIAQTVTPKGINELVEGKRNFSDPELVKIIDGWKGIYSKDLAQLDQGSQLFNQGKVAMMASGYWAIVDARKALGDDLGVFKMPDFGTDVKVHDGGVGGVGAAFVITNYSKNKKEAFKFVEFLNSKEEQIKRLESGEASLTHLKDIDISKYTDEPLLIQNQLWANESSTIFWPDNIFPSELTDEIWKLFPLAFNGKMSAEEFMKSLDEKRDEILSKK